jgi:uncharacterized protein (TIGR03435 family)
LREQFWAPWSRAASGETALDPAAPTFEQALKDQFGLKLESQKSPVTVLVLDHIDHPSQN